MKFHLFMLPTVVAPHEFSCGMAGQNPELYQRTLRQVGVVFAAKVRSRFS